MAILKRASCSNNQLFERDVSSCRKLSPRRFVKVYSREAISDVDQLTRTWDFHESASAATQKFSMWIKSEIAGY